MPECEEIMKGFIDPDSGGPAKLPRDLSAATDDQRHVGFPQLGRVNSYRDGEVLRSLPDQHIQHLPEWNRLPRGDVIDLAPAALSQEQYVGSNHVSDVAKIPLDIEIPDHEHRSDLASLDLDDLAGPIRTDEIVRLAGARMGERPTDHNVEVLKTLVEFAQHLAGGLGIGVRISDAERRFFG